MAFEQDAPSSTQVGEMTFNLVSYSDPYVDNVRIGRALDLLTTWFHLVLYFGGGRRLSGED